MQRVIEGQGIATVGVSLAREISEKVRPPRTCFIRYPFGHAFGEPFNKKQQMQIFRDCLQLLETAAEPGEIRDCPYRWRRHDFNDEPVRTP